MSPIKKKSKLERKIDYECPTKKRECDEPNVSSKRIKTNKNKDEELHARKRKNFVTACEQVSYKAYFNYNTRLHLIYIPPCASGSACIHHTPFYIKELPSYAEESFNIEMNTNAWSEALEVGILSIRPNQYLSANVLKDIVEIMLNAHEDDSETTNDLIEKCQQLLSQQFNTHPPCLNKNLRTCYRDFLMLPMNLKENSFTNRTQFGCNEGIVKYCMNRLEYELSFESKDEPIINYNNIPEEIKQSVKGLYWQKEKCEIYEALERPERIQRLMAILDSIIELLQFDLAIWTSRYTNNRGCHIMRSQRPLMALVLWSQNILYTGAVNNNCKQILRIFVHMVHLNYPEEHINTMIIWINAIVQTFYISETNSTSDYPNLGKYCMSFANEFYKIIKGLPHSSFLKILERIQPKYMQYLVGILHVKTHLKSDEDCVIKILIDFLKNTSWQTLPEANSAIEIVYKSPFRPRKVKRKLSYLSKIVSNFDPTQLEDEGDHSYPKLNIQPVPEGRPVNMLRHIVHTLYITLEAYLDAYSVQNVQDTLEILNKQLLEEENNDVKISDPLPVAGYTVSEEFIKRYRHMYKMIKELILTLKEMKNNGCLPDILQVFGNIGLLDL